MLLIFDFKSTVFFYKCLPLLGIKYQTTIIMQYIRTILLLFLTVFATSLIAQTRIQSVHQVVKGETLHSLSEKYGVTIADLLSVNPEMSAKPNKKIKKGYLVNIPERKTNRPDSLVSQDTFCVAVVLPLTTAGKEGERCLEFYRGLLMAADKERENGRVVKVVAIDEPGVKQGVSEVVNALLEIKPSAIVGPLYPQHFSAMSEVAKSLSVQLIVPFSSKVKEVETNSNIHLLNAPTAVVQELSWRLFDSLFGKKRCVVIKTKDATDAEVVNHWVSNLKNKGREVKTLSSNFTQQDLLNALHPNQSNVIVLDGSNQENVLSILNKVREYTNDATTHSISVVGHNAWQTFTMEHHKLLGLLDTHILSQDYYNAHSKQVIAFEEAYHQWFKHYPLQLHPRMGELGYDTGLYLFNAQRENSLKDASGKDINYLQSILKFQKLGYGGYVNASMMFLRFGSSSTPDIIE